MNNSYILKAHAGQTAWAQKSFVPLFLKHKKYRLPHREAGEARSDMAVEEYYFRKLHEVLTEIRDEMRGLREEMQAFLAMPQPIIVNGSNLPGPTKEELEKQFHEWERRSNGS